MRYIQKSIIREKRKMDVGIEIKFLELIKQPPKHIPENTGVFQMWSLLGPLKIQEEYLQRFERKLKKFLRK